MKYNYTALMQEAVEAWKATKGEGMSRSELELARARFQELRNSRQVRRINQVLIARVLRAVEEMK